MLNNSLIEILRTLNKEEIKKFEELVDSPYFNKKTGVRKLFKIIKKYYPGFKSERLRKENIWKSMFPDKEYNYGVIKNLIYDLHKLLEKFLEMTNYEKKKSELSFNLIEAYYHKNLDNAFEKNLKTYEETLTNRKIDENYFGDLLKLESLKQEHRVFNRRVQENIKSFSLGIEYLFSDFLIQYFRINLNIIILKNDFKSSETDLRLIEYFINYISKHEFRFKGILLLYYYAFMMIQSSNDIFFFKLKDLALQYCDKLGQIEKFNIFTGLTNFCVIKSMSGEDKFENEEFELYKIIIEKNAFTPYENGYINYLTYYNIARLASKLKQFDWAYDFIKKYESLLIPEQREHSYLYALAFIEFEKGDFTKSLDHVSKLKYTEIRQKPRIKMLSLMLYFELGYSEQLFSLIDTSRHFSKNDSQLSDEYKDRFFRFVNIVNKISKIKFEFQKESEKNFNLSNLMKELSSEDLPNKYWLINKVKELEKIKSKLT